MNFAWFMCPSCGVVDIHAPCCGCSWESRCPSCKKYRTACDDRETDNKTTMVKEAH